MKGRMTMELRKFKDKYQVKINKIYYFDIEEEAKDMFDKYWKIHYEFLGKMVKESEENKERNIST